MATSQDLRQQTTAPDPWALLARQRAFALVSQRLLRTRTLPSAHVVFWEPADYSRKEGADDPRAQGVFVDLCVKGGGGGGRGGGEGGLVCDVVEGLEVNGYHVDTLLGDMIGERAWRGESEDGSEEGGVDWDLVVVVGGGQVGVTDGWFRRLKERVGGVVVVWWTDGGVDVKGGGEKETCACLLGSEQVDVCVSPDSDVEAFWARSAEEGRLGGGGLGGVKDGAVVIWIARAHRVASAAVGEMLALVSSAARAELSAIRSSKAPVARMAAYHAVSARRLANVGLLEPAAGTCNSVGAWLHLHALHSVRSLLQKRPVILGSFLERT